MLGVTTYATRDLTPFPLLWVLPLAIYLLTFVAAFAPRAQPDRLVRLGRILLPGIAIVVVYTLAIGSQRPLWLLLPLHLLGLGVAALMCHARLAADRPPAARLTEFYVWVALGGVLGGVFNAIVAPGRVPRPDRVPARARGRAAAAPEAANEPPGAARVLLPRPAPDEGDGRARAGAARRRRADRARPRGHELQLTQRRDRAGVRAGAEPVEAAAAARARASARSSLAVALAGAQPLERSRSFFGIYKVVQEGAHHLLYDGTTVHGLQRVGSPEPLEYYGRAGPAGQAFAALRPQHVGAVGLGAGALACYGHVTFFEIDPEVVRIARDPRLFTYLRSCPSRVLVGDGRRLLVKEPPGRFQLVVVDAFNSDAIPVHLITQQALALYLERAPVVLFHISNRYLRLEGVLGNLARDGGLTCRVETHHPSQAQVDQGLAVSKWALLARTPAALGRLGADPRWHACGDDPSARVWTDDYSDLLSAIAWG